MNVTHLHRFSSSGHAAARFVAQRVILKSVVWTQTRVTVVGREALEDLTDPFIVVANHSSHLDAPLITGALPRARARYLAAGAAADYFFDVAWRRALTALFFNAFPVDRSGSGARSGLAKELLGRGVPLLIFPQGGRSKDNTIGPFKPGAATLSAMTGAPCVPVAIVGAAAAMPPGRNWPMPGRPPIVVAFGEPTVAAPGETAAEFSARLHRTVLERHAAHAA